ncbi:MAG: 2OG-Fe(II) oxygenase [Rhodospirillales bacterium]|nr:2OG-Fe(II) oxygenase [Rhodospirillales bacterium]
MLIDLQAYRDTPLATAPYPHLVVPGFVARALGGEVARDFPRLDVGGLFLPESSPPGPLVAQLIAELESDTMRLVVSEKLGIDLDNCPTLTTIRSRCQARDGRIHPDASFKVATMLLYLNDAWMPDGGRLRVLNSGEDIEDYSAEVSPEFGTLVCFRVQPNSWHGHKPFVGPRRYIMLNYCRDAALRDAEAKRHLMSTRIKKIRRFFQPAARAA